MDNNDIDTIPFLDLANQHALLKDELLAVMAKAIDDTRFIGGPAVERFEASFASFAECKYAVGVGSGTDALRLALLALGVKPGQRVVTVPNTFIATTEAISQAGASIDFVDVDSQTCLMDPNRLEELLRSRFDKGPLEMRPAAVVPVHLYGSPAEMDSINQLAQRYDLKVLEDSAQAHGATYRGKAAGSLAQAAAFSFYPGKNLGACGEAGAITTDDPELAEQARMLRDHGQHVKYHHKYEGYNARLDAIQAGFMLVKLPYLQDWNSRRRAVAQTYDQAFDSLSWVRPVKVHPHVLPSRHLYVIHVPDRHGLQDHLARRGIQTGLHYPVPLHLQPCYQRMGWMPGDFPSAENSASHLLSLPLFPELQPPQIQRVIQAVESFGHEHGY